MSRTTGAVVRGILGMLVVLSGCDKSEQEARERRRADAAVGKMASVTVPEPVTVRPTPWSDMAKGYVVESAEPLLPYWEQTTTITIAKQTKDGRSFQFSMKVGPLDTLTPEKTDAEYLWGWGDPKREAKDPMGIMSSEDQLRRARHVHDLSLSVGGRVVHIPKSAYVDLIDLYVYPHWCFLRADGDRLLLDLKGSDAGESYRVRFTIRDHRLVKREIWRGEFPEMGPDVKTFPSDTKTQRTSRPSIPQRAKQ